RGGVARLVLQGVSVALNLLERVCGVASPARQVVDAAGRNQRKILDTRKTKPGLRELEKKAVVAGGGMNHRFGLDDMVLVKDNHLRCLADSFRFAEAVGRVRAERPGLRIEVECDDLRQVPALLKAAGVDL